MWFVLAFTLAFLVAVVPLLVFVCVRDETWGDGAAPLVRWIHSRRIRAFAAAAATGDFSRAELLVEHVMSRSPINIEPPGR
jgi:hypothetical protein